MFLYCSLHPLIPEKAKRLPPIFKKNQNFFKLIIILLNMSRLKINYFFRNKLILI